MQICKQMHWLRTVASTGSYTRSDHRNMKCTCKALNRLQKDASEHTCMNCTDTAKTHLDSHPINSLLLWALLTVWVYGVSDLSSTGSLPIKSHTPDSHSPSRLLRGLWEDEGAGGDGWVNHLHEFQLATLRNFQNARSSWYSAEKHVFLK